MPSALRHSVPRYVFIFCVLCFAVFHFSENSVDNDLWGHVLFGQELLQTGHLARTEPYSWTAPGHPWINHEILAEAALGLAHRALGGPGLLLLKIVVGLLTLLLALAIAVKQKANEPQPPLVIVAWVFGALAVVEIARSFAARRRFLPPWRSPRNFGCSRKSTPDAATGRSPCLRSLPCGSTPMAAYWQVCWPCFSPPPAPLSNQSSGNSSRDLNWNPFPARPGGSGWLWRHRSWPCSPILTAPDWCAGWSAASSGFARKSRNGIPSASVRYSQLFILPPSWRLPAFCFRAARSRFGSSPSPACSVSWPCAPPVMRHCSVSPPSPLPHPISLRCCNGFRIRGPIG